MYVSLQTSVPIVGGLEYAKRTSCNMDSMATNRSRMCIHMVLVVSINSWLINNNI